MSELIEGDEYVMTVRVKVLGVEDDGRVAIRFDGVKRHMTVLAPTEAAAATFTPVPAEPVVTYRPGQTVRDKGLHAHLYTIGVGGYYSHYLKKWEARPNDVFTSESYDLCEIVPVERDS